MGKSKQQPRAKGSLKAASSSRAAELAGQSSNTALSFSNLGGFAQFASPSIAIQTSSRPATPGSDASDTSDLDPELVLVIKKINKRDTTTKLKALEELDSYLNSHLYVISSILPTWVILYNKLVLEVDRRVRLATVNIHQQIALHAKKKLAPYLKEFIGPWLISMFDQSKDVAKASKISFESIFSEEKRQEVLKFCQKNILEYVTEMLLNKTVETLSDARYVSPEDMTAKYARVMASCIYAITYLIDSLSEDERMKLATDYNALLDSPSFWKLVSHDSPILRTAVYHLIKVLILNWSEMIQSRLEIICPEFYASVFSNKDVSSHSEMWDSLLLMTKKFPDSWMLISKKKSPLSKLYNFLRSGLNGSTGIAYPSLIALLANLPTKLKEEPNFYKDVFANFWKGLSSSPIDNFNSQDVINAYAECTTYFAMKNRNNNDISKYLIDTVFFDAIKSYFIQTKENATYFNKFNDQCGISLAKQLMILTKSDVSTDALWAKLDTFWIQIIIDCNGPVPNEKVDIPSYCKKLGSFLSCIQNQQYPIESKKCISGLIQRLFTSAIESSLVHKDFTPDLLALSEVLMNSFTTIVINDLDTINTSKLLLSLLPSLSKPSIPSLMSVYVSIVNNLSDQSVKNQLWENIIICLYELESCNNELQQIMTITSLLNQIQLQKPHLDFKTKHLNLLMEKLTSDLFLKNPTSNNEIQIDEIRQSLLQNVLIQALTLHIDHAILSDESFNNILENILVALQSFNQHHYSINNTNQNVNTPSDNLSNSIVKSTLNILLNLLDTKNHATFLLNHSSMKDLPSHIFDTTFVKNIKASIPEDENQDELVMLSKSVWERLVSTIQDNKDTNSQIKHGLLYHVKESIIDVTSVISPLESVERAQSLLTSLFEDRSTEDYQMAVTTLIGTLDNWTALYNTLREKRTLEYLESAVIDQYASMDSQMIWEDKDELFPVQYDIFDLSSLGRLVLFTTTFILDVVGVESFFNTSNEKDVYQRDWLVRMIMQIGLECYQGLGNPGLSRLWKFNSVIAAGITELTQNSHVIFDKWFNLISAKIVLNNTSHFIYEKLNSEDNKVDNRLLHFTLTSLKEKSDVTDAYYAKFIQLLMDKLVIKYQWDAKQLEEWLSILKAESKQVSPLTKAALMISFKNIIGTSSSYQRLQSEYVNKLSGSKGMQVFDDSPEAWQWLILLNASSLQFSFINIPTQRLMYLVTTLRDWFGQDSDDHLGIIERKKIQAQIALLFKNIADAVQEVSGNQWDFFLDCIYEWISYNDSNDSDSLPLIYNTMTLFSKLYDMKLEGNSYVATVIDEHWDKISHTLWKAFINEKEIDLPVSLSRQRYQELLAKLMNTIPQKLILKNANLDTVGPLLGAWNDSIQKQAYSILKQWIKEYVVDLTVQLEFTQNEEDSAKYSINDYLFQRLIHLPDLTTWDITTVDEKRLHEILEYMISWLLMFEHFHDITFKLKQEYTSQLKEADALDKLMVFIFKILNVGAGQGTQSFDLTLWDCSTYDLDGFDITIDISYSLLASHLYYLALKHVPSLVRNWWVNCKQRQLVIAVEQYTEDHFSNILVSDEMALISQPDVKEQLEENENEFKVKALTATNEVAATYCVDEQTMQISIKLPKNYPLQQIQVEGVQKVGVSDKQWRGWMFAIAAVIGSQNGNVVDALTVFKRNVNLHFDGVGDCVICYSIISVLDRSIPTKQCRTCKNKFHASCLYKWFRSSNSASCPLCRTVF
ncbi:hypothetical protein BJ944DRAFT_247631 [Cunninghamella echinulata]|nr:hypothetical protein BJ944DRAFT_247631 [Cunninghamella echinulata]